MTFQKHLIFVLHELNSTGAPSFAIRFAEKLITRGWSVSVIAKEGGALENHPIFRTVAPPLITKTGHVRRPSQANATARLQQAIEMCGRGIVIANSFASADACLASNNLGYPTILFSHEMAPAISELRKAKVIPRRFRPRLDALLAISTRSLEVALQKVVLPADSPRAIIGNFVNPEQLRNLAKAAPSRTKLSNSKDERFRVAMCGPFCEAKGADYFVAAARNLPDVDFVWIGPEIPTKKVLALKKSIARSPVPNLAITGQVPNAPSFLARCDLFALTSRFDSNPTVLLEALTLGVPVIAFKEALGEIRLVSEHGTLLPGKPDTNKLINFIRQSAFSTDQRKMVTDSDQLDVALSGDNSLRDFEAVISMLKWREKSPSRS